MADLVVHAPHMRRASELFTDEVTRPTCARCQRPVDSFTVRHNAFFRQVIITIRCHGAEDYVRLDEEQLVDPCIGEVFGEGHAPRWGG